MIIGEKRVNCKPGRKDGKSPFSGYRKQGVPDMPATIRDIKRLTGLSLATISKYLNGGNVLPENRTRIENAIDELGYEVNEIARWLATKKTKTVGVIVFNIQSLFNSTLLSYISASLRMAGYGLLICDSAENLEQESKNIRFLLNKKVDGILIIPVNGENHDLQQAEDAGIPVVLLDRPLPGKCCVKIDNTAAACQATELLIQHHHQDIAIIGFDSEYTGRKRSQGYRQAMEAHGFPIRKSFEKIGKDSIQFGYRSMLELLKLKRRPTAVFMTNYEITLGGVMAMNESGINCPADISLLGFDNLILSQIVKPKLTMVVQPMKEIAEEAAEILLKEMEAAGSGICGREVINLPTHIEIGNSVKSLQPAD